MSEGQAHLLEANTLIGMVVSDHQNYAPAGRLATGAGGIGIWPMVEGGLARFVKRGGDGQASALAVLRALDRAPRWHLRADAPSYDAMDIGHVVRHRHVSDGYVAGLPEFRGGRLHHSSAAWPSRWPMQQN